MNAGFISFRFFGIDGVSLETKKMGYRFRKIKMEMLFLMWGS